MKLITVHYPSGLPDDTGKLQWLKAEFIHDPLKSIRDYCDDLQLDAGLIGHVIYQGAVLRPDAQVERTITPPRWKFWRKPEVIVETVDQLAATYLHNGDEFHVVPNVTGKHASTILGVVGAVVGIALAAYTGGGSLALLQAAMTGYALGSTLGALVTPRPQQSKGGDDAPTSYAWQGISNDDRAGVPVPVVFGKHRTGGVRIGSFIRREEGKERLYMLLLVSKGPIHAINDIRINDQPWTNYQDGGTSDITIETRLGTTGQSVIPGFNKTANTYAQNTELTGTPFTYTTNSADLDAIEVLLTIPGLCHINSKGELKDNTTRYQYRYKKTTDVTYGAWVNKARNGSTRSTVYENIRIEGLDAAQYDIQLQFVSADNTNATNDLWKIFVTGITEEKQTPPGSGFYDGYALIAIKALATDKISGGLPVITSLVSGVLVDVWNGTSFDPPAFIDGSGNEVGRSPAWVALKLFRDPNFGLGRWVSDDNLRLSQFKELADYALTPVLVTPDDGSAATNEPAFLLDVVLNQQTPALDLITNLLATCRATPTLSGNRWGIFVDKPTSPTQLFTMGNIVRDSFSITYRSEKEAFNAFDVTFLNAERDYDTDTLTVVSKEQVDIEGKPIKKQTLQLFGVTRKSQATREGKFNLNKAHYLRRAIGFNASSDSVLMEVGDVFNFQHDLPQWGWGGRIMPGSTSTAIQLDGDVTVEIGKAYQLLVRPADGSHEEGYACTVVATPGTYQALVVAGGYPFTPTEGDLWAFGETHIAVKPYRCVSISRNGIALRAITAVEYNESLLDFDDEVEVITYSQLPNFAAPPPAITSVTAYEEIAQKKDNSYPSTIFVQWPRPLPESSKGVYMDALVEFSYNNVNWSPLGYGIDEYRWPTAPHGTTIYFRVTPRSTRFVLNYGGRASTSITTTGKTTGPALPASFTGKTWEGAFLFTWAAVDAATEYELRTSNPASWSTDTTGFVWRGRGTSFAQNDPPLRSQTYYLRSVDEFGNYSVAALSVALNDSAPAAPTIGTITRLKNSLKIPVTPPADTDVIGMHLHASQTPGFTPAAANRVSGVVSAKGGDFVFAVPTSGTWYFRATAEDWLSERLNDFVYSSESSSSIIVVNPVDPGSITFAANPDDSSNVITLPNGQTRPRILFAPTITWAHTDAINPANSLVGFQVVIYKSTGSVTNNVHDSGLLATPAQRAYTAKGIIFDASATYIAAVKAVYIDGLTSNYVTSLGAVIDLPTNPNFQTQDDHVVYAYAESFDGLGAFPTGFSQSGMTGLTFGNGGFFFTQSGASCSLTWNINTWKAAYLDTQLGGEFRSIMIRVGFTSTPGATLPYVTPAFAGTNFTYEPVKDGAAHTYHIDLGSFLVLPTDTITFTFPAGCIPVGGFGFVSAVAVGIKDFDSTLDGFMDRAQRARDQFDRDPVGGGYFLQSPIHLPTDPSGNQLIVDKNGFYWLRNASGIITETPYKLGRQTQLINIANGVYVGYDSAGRSDGGPIPNPTIPTPTASNKSRFVIEKSGGAGQEAAAAGYPVREYFDISGFDNSIAFKFSRAVFEGGTLGAIIASSPWTPSSSFHGRSALTEQSYAAQGGNQWDISSARAYLWAHDASGWNSGVNTYYFRRVVWIKVVMPNAKAANGSRYYADLLFQAWFGRVASLSGVGGMTLDAVNHYASGQYKARCLSDGNTWRFPITTGGIENSTYGEDYQSFKVDWLLSTLENAAAAPVSVAVEKVEWHFIDTPAAVRSTGAGTYRLTYLEEF
jgi:predicted phage tail protein